MLLVNDIYLSRLNKLLELLHQQEVISEGNIRQIKDLESILGEGNRQYAEALRALSQRQENEAIKKTLSDLVLSYNKGLCEQERGSLDNNEVIEKFMVQIRQLKEWVYPAVDSGQSSALGTSTTTPAYSQASQNSGLLMWSQDSAGESSSSNKRPHDNANAQSQEINRPRREI